MTQNRTPAPDHARHDRLLVVRYLDLDDELLAGEVSEARRLLASCPDCTALATELQLIADATNHMALPSRPRDFRLTPQQAASLQPGGLRRFLETAARAFRFEFLRPLAGAAVAVGLLLAVVGALPLSNSASPTDLAAGGAGTQRGAPAQLPTTAPALVAAPATAAAFNQQPTAETANSSPVPQSDVASGAPMAVATAKAGTSPRTPSVTAALPPLPAASDNSAIYGPSTGTTTAVGPGGTAQAYLPPAESSSAAANPGGLEQTPSTVSPLLILGALLAVAGLLVLLLTFAARRNGRSAG